MTVRWSLKPGEPLILRDPRTGDAIELMVAHAAPGRVDLALELPDAVRLDTGRRQRPRRDRRRKGAA